MNRLPTRPSRRDQERGSASLEAAIGVPAFLLLIGLILLAGRVSLMRQAVQAVAADAARAASISRTAGEAEAARQLRRHMLVSRARTPTVLDNVQEAAKELQAAAAAAGNAGVDQRNLTCLTLSVSADTSGFAVPVGTPATVSATVTCRVNLTGVDLPGLGEREVTATMVSPLDTYRGRP